MRAWMQLFERHKDITVSLSFYKDRSDIYISFTDLPKIGINPLTEYDTPIGIYTYPLKEIWNDIHNNSIPFGSGRRYVHVLQSILPVQDVASYTEAQYAKDKAHLQRIFDDTVHKPTSYPNFELWEREAKPKGLAAAKLWNVSRNLADLIVKNSSNRHSAVTWNGLLRALGYNAFSDKTGTGLIHPNEPIQTVFLTLKAFQQVEMLHNVRRSTEPIRLYSFYDIADLFDSHYYNRVALLREWPKLLSTGKSRHFEIPDWSEIDWYDFGIFYERLIDHKSIPSVTALAIKVATTISKQEAIADCILQELAEIFKLSYNKSPYFTLRIKDALKALSNPVIEDFLRTYGDPVDIKSMTEYAKKAAFDLGYTIPHFVQDQEG